MPDLVELLTAGKTTEDREDCLALARTWNLQHEGKETLGHIGRSLDINPNTQKIRALFSADLSREEGQEIGEYLVRVAQQLGAPHSAPKIPKRKLMGRSWSLDRIGYGRWWEHSMAEINPLIEDGRQYAVHFSIDADLSPRRAREIGSYLAAVARQCSE